MARTRAQIKTFVGHFTGRATDKASLIELLCDEALRIALAEHPFKDARSYDQDFPITTSATSVSIATLTDIAHVLSATIIETSGEDNKPIEFKNETWWNENVVNAEDNTQGWPGAALRRGTTVLFDRPVDSGLSLRLVVTENQTFSSDSTECPIAIADVFVTQYVTAMVFLSIEEREKYMSWYTLAMGQQYPINGKVGGTLAQIIDQDKRDIAEQYKAQRKNAGMEQSGVSVLNQITGHDDYGNIRLWSAP